MSELIPPATAPAPDTIPDDSVPDWARGEGEARPANPELIMKLREETITADLALSEAEIAACGKRMADALREKADLEDQLDMYRKGINARIKEAEKESLDAARIFHRGKEERRVSCDVIGDYNTGELIWTEKSAPYREVQRRPMVGSEKQLPLPGLNGAEPADGQEGEQVDAVTGEVLTGDQAGDAGAEGADSKQERSCGTCGLAEMAGNIVSEYDESPCHSCNLDTLSNWLPRATGEGATGQPPADASDAATPEEAA